MNNTEFNSKKIKSFTDLNCWQEGHKLALGIYRATSLFPRNEEFGLTSQIKRAVVSITSNIAEGFSRYSYKEKCQFYYISLGSVTEVQNQLLLAKDLGFIKEKDNFTNLANQTVILSKLINGLIKSTKSHNSE